MDPALHRPNLDARWLGRPDPTTLCKAERLRLRRRPQLPKKLKDLRNDNLPTNHLCNSQNTTPPRQEPTPRRTTRRGNDVTVTKLPTLTFESVHERLLQQQQR